MAYSAPVEITIEYNETTPTCTESWTCTDWSSCVGGTQTRTCTDSNNCGTTSLRPSLSQSCTTGGGGGGGGGGGIPTVKAGNVTITQPVPNIPPISPTKESPYVKLEILTVDEIEAGEPFTTNVIISSKIPIQTIVELLGKKQSVSLSAEESKTLFFEIYAPETGGDYNIVAVTSEATGNKIVHLEYKPLFLYVNLLGNNTYEIHLKNFDNASTTELEIVKDKIQTVYLDSMNGNIDYKINLTFSSPGEYLVKAKAMYGYDILDEDIRFFKIEGEPEINYGLLALIVVLIIILIGSILIFKQLKR